MNMRTWGIGTGNQLFATGSYTQIKFSKKQRSQWQKSILCDRSISYSLTLAFDKTVLSGNVALSFLVL